MGEEKINYYEQGTKIGNYSIYDGRLVVDNNNNVLLKSKPYLSNIHGFRDIIYDQYINEVDIYSAKDFSQIANIPAALICLDELRDKYLINLGGLIDDDDIRVLDSEFNVWDSPSIKGSITWYKVHKYENDTVRIVFEFDGKDKNVFDENLVCLNQSPYSVVKLLDKNTAIVGDSEQFYCICDFASRACLKKDNKEYHFDEYVFFDLNRQLIAVKEADMTFRIINYMTLEPFFDTSFDDVQPYGEHLFGASINGIRGIYNDKLELQFELPYERCLFPFKHSAACFRIHEGDKQKNVAIDDKGHILFSFDSNYEVDDILIGRIFAMKYVDDNGLYKITKYKILGASGESLPNGMSLDDIYDYHQMSNGNIALTYHADSCGDPPYCKIISNKGEIVKDDITLDVMWDYMSK
jgi:hypothetical protein